MTLLRVFALAFILAACSSSDENVVPSPITFAAGDTAYCIALGADYRNNVGTMAAVALPSLTVTTDLFRGSVSGDPVLRVADGKLFVVNRTAANVTVIDTATWAIERQFSTGAGSDPQDIAVVGDKAYVTAYATGSLQVWDLADAQSQTPKKTIDISSYDPDGVPNANSVVVQGGRAFVTLDILDTETVPQPQGLGKVVVVDTASDTILSDFDLTFTNPYGFLVATGDTLFVPTVADFSATAGCVESIKATDPVGVNPCLVTNADLGGTVSAIAVGGGTTYLAVSSADFTSASLRAVAGGTVSTVTPSSQSPTDVAVAPGGLVVYSDLLGDGLRVYDPSRSAELTTAALSLGLSPASAGGIGCLAR